jgi:hypothetical protein
MKGGPPSVLFLGDGDNALIYSSYGGRALPRRSLRLHGIL